MKYLGSDGDINLSSTQHIYLLGSDTISQCLENTYMKKKDTMTIKDPTLLEVIKNNSVSFEKKTINHITAENVIVTSIDKWLFPNPKKMDELRDSIRLPIMQGIYGELGKDKHIHSNLYPPKVIITSNGKQEISLKKISFKAKMYKGEFTDVNEITELYIIHQV